MASNNSGRTVLFILSLVIVILVCGVAISLFLLQKETQARTSTEASLADVSARNVKIDAALKEAGKQIEVLKGKNKDADDKINGLMEELDLKVALLEQIKADSKKLKDTLESEAKSKIELREKFSAELEGVQAKLKEAEDKINSQAGESAGLKQKAGELQKKNDELEGRLKDLEQSGAGRPRAEILPVPGQPGDEKVDLDRIVITPEGAKEGRVLNVDPETEFLIFDLGSKNGIKPGAMMSVFRGKTYLGDVKVSRVQEEMSAADLVPPFSSRKVRKNDQVVPKR